MITTESAKATAQAVHETISKHMIGDGLSMVLDLDSSHGSKLVDKLTGTSYIDFFTFYASNPIGLNHPGLRGNAEFLDRLQDAAINKVANSDVYTEHMARFVSTFSRVGIPDYLPHLFLISGGALAVENALKTAFDWKVRKNYEKGHKTEKGHQIMHFKQAFHGRSGYTLSLTNTVPNKVMNFPMFDWPRISNPKANGRLSEEELELVKGAEASAIEEMKAAFLARPDEIAGIILEPIQGEGGDNHFRVEFLNQLKQLGQENDALLIFDEVQSGVGLTGSFWAHQALGVHPDIIAFGKKTQVCGILAGPRVDEVEDNVFSLSSRINSTWGGNLVDMVRFDRILEIIEEDNLVQNAKDVGDHLLTSLYALEEEFPFVSKSRGMGLMCAFDLDTPENRDKVKKLCYDGGLVVLGCGHSSIRFRPALNASKELIDEGVGILKDALSRC